MHTDDDIFESLDIDESLNKTLDTGADKAGAVADYLDEDNAADDIFESLDMEDRIYDTAFTPKPNSDSAKQTASGGRNAGERRNVQAAQSTGRTGNASQSGASGSRADSIQQRSTGGTQGSRAGAAPGSRNTAVQGDSANNSRNGGRGNAGHRDLRPASQRSADYDEFDLGEPKHKTHKTPKELNTADTSLDRRKITSDKEKKKKSRIKHIIIAAIVEIFTLAAIFAYGYVLKSWNMIARPQVRLEAVENNNISVEKKKEMEGYWNIAVFGVDSRGDSVVERGINSDVIMIVSINKDTGDIKIVSVFRDTYLNISDKNSYNKINQAYAIGGPEQALAALNKNLDLNIQHYVAFNWKAVAEGINILGGVDNIPISKAELYYINAYITETVKVTKIGSVQLTSTGEQHLDGVQAVAYGRLRYMDNDFARTERQRNILKAAFAKAKNANFSVLNNIMVVCFPQVATNIEFNEVVDMAQHITQYNIADTGGFPWSRGDANVGSKGDCVVPTTLESNVIKLHEFLFGDTNYQPTNAVLNISEKIKSDSGRYKEGKVIESVATDGGVIQKKKASTAETKSPAEEEAEDSSQSSSKNKKSTIGVDEEGNYIYPTDADGNIVIPTDADGNVIYPTDADGSIIKESSAARPTELSTEDLVPGDLDESDEPLDGPVPSTTAQNQMTSASNRETTGLSHNTTETTSSANTNGPGSNTSNNTSSNTSSNTSTAGPGDNTSSGSASNSPGGSSSSGTSTSPGGNISSEPIISNDGPGSISTGSTSGPGGSSSTSVVSDGPG